MEGPTWRHAKWIGPKGSCVAPVILQADECLHADAVTFFSASRLVHLSVSFSAASFSVKHVSNLQTKWFA